jgi:glycosyltransferase involved in cell wall biosynthesis
LAEALPNRYLKMRIVHIAGGDLSGGAARGAYWLHKGLLKLGIESYFVIPKATDNDLKNVFVLNRTKKDKISARLIHILNQLPVWLYKNRKNEIFSTNFYGRNLLKLPILERANIIHLHWISDVVSLKFFSRCQKPIVWTFRDMWPFTGGCHCTLECQRFKERCGKCPVLGSNKSFDLSYLVWRLKRRYFKKGSFYPVAISKWLAQTAMESSLFKDFEVKVIHNGVDTEVFYPIDKQLSRQILGLPIDKKIILSGAGYDSPWKGFDKLLGAINILKNSNFYFAFFGKISNKLIKFLQSNNITFKIFGFLYDDISLRLVYSAADVFVAPSIQEGFGKTLIEAMACGTPVVCFDATGPKDIVTHKIDGYKARPFDETDLANGIRWILSLNQDNFNQLCLNARKKVISNFSIEVIAKKYIEIYEEILGQ